MYSCHKPRESIVQLKTVSWEGFKSVHECRFDMRYDPLHQANGCKDCNRKWDVIYLKQQGLIKW
jgi:hypothetical protein